MADPGLWISEREVAELIDLPDAIETLASTYRAPGSASGLTMPRAHLRAGDAILHAVGGALAEDGVAGTKTWVYSPGGASPLLVLFSLHDGSVRGVIEAFGLGQLRTAATSGLGTRTLARPDSRTLALIGTGKQAFAQARAVCLVSAVATIRLFGRNGRRRSALANRLRTELDVTVTEHQDVGQALVDADIVTTITRAAEPLLDGDMLSPGTHINAVGAIVPSRRELAPSAVERCDVIVADSKQQAMDDSGELRAAVDEGRLTWDRVQSLKDVIGDDPRALRQQSSITLFKAVGVGLSDVALGAEVVRRAVAANAGTPLPSSPTAQ
jgi:alanine dehydrogenase